MDSDKIDSIENLATDLDVFNVIERTCSVLSLVGCVFIIVTFCVSDAFHKPINRLVFYASFGNMMTNVATLMARIYIPFPESAGCQFQAFLIQMFMPADAFWILAMAINVYLTFYAKFDAQKLRKMEIPYLLFCYGIPFTVALVFVFVSSPSKGKIYGDATLWCWVKKEWDIFRIITFYGPVWAAIAVTTFIYVRAGREIYRKHKQLRDLNYTSHYEPEMNPMNDPFSVKTTEVSVTSEIVTTAQDTPIDLAPLGRAHRHSSAGHQSKPSAYSVSISADVSKAAAAVPTATVNSSGRSAENTTQRSGRRRANHDANNAAWSYTKCSILFFTAILVTWIPSTANRVYGVVQPDGVSLPLEYTSAFVLPLQGFWNAVIYIVTSWKACKTLWDDVRYFFFKGGRKTNVPARLTTTSRRGVQRDNVSVPGRTGKFEMMSRGRNTRVASDMSSGSGSTEELRYGVV